jgi:ubiquinone/menaquinone biosynthesis C-methylase UbiE
MSEAETIWGVGDYPLMAERLEDAARRAIARADVTTDDRVLDIACGTGNAALAAAPLAGSVAGVDFEPALLNVARSRSKDVGATVDWMVGDALALPFEDGAFDVVLSVFGIMYAAD